MVNLENVEKVIDIDGTVLVKTTMKVYDSKVIEDYTNADGKLHRLGGPARTSGNTYFEYWVNGKRHRLDGPARIWPDGTQQYWLDGIKYTEEQYPKAVSEYKLKQLVG